MKRLQIPIDQETERVLQEYADALDSTVPRVVTAMLEDSVEGIREITIAVLEVKKARDVAIDKVHLAVAQMHDRVKRKNRPRKKRQ